MSLSSRLLGYWAMSLLFILGASSTFAKQVELDWDEMDLAVSYELEIKPQKGQATQYALHSPSWSAYLDFGIYTYRVRAVDRFGRPGAWTEEQKLVVMPPAPLQLTPEDGSELAGEDTQDVRLSWQSVPDAAEYRVQVERKGETVVSTSTQNTYWIAKALPAGIYHWRIKAILESKKHQSKWETDLSDRFVFAVGSRAGGESMGIYRSYLGFGAGVVRQVDNASTTLAGRGLLQYGRKLSPGLSLGSVFGFGYSSTLKTRDWTLGAFLEVSPKSWFFYGRAYFSGIRTEGSSVPTTQGFGPGFGLGSKIHQSTRFRIVPEIRYDIYRAPRDPVHLGIIIFFVGDI